MIEILSAKYGLVGSTKDKMDVTENVRSLLSPDRRVLVFSVSPSALGVSDPSPGNPKELSISYSVDGSERNETIRDASTLMAKSYEPPPQNTAGFAISLFTSTWSKMITVAAVFLYIMSVAFAFEFGKTLFNPFLWLAIALLIPYASFWIIPVVIILMRIFSPQDFIVIRGGRR